MVRTWLWRRGGPLAGNGSLRPGSRGVGRGETAARVCHVHEEQTAISASWPGAETANSWRWGRREGRLTLWNLPSLRSAVASLDLEWPPGQSVAATTAERSPRELLAAFVEAESG